MVDISQKIVAFSEYMNFRDIGNTLGWNAFGGSITIVMYFQKEVHRIVDDVRRHKNHKIVSGKSRQATDINENLIHSKQISSN